MKIDHPHEHTPPSDSDYQRPVMIASLVVALFMLGGKTTAFVITGSAAILSDALESVIHLFATGFAAYSMWYASRPADASHPYGHGKITYFSSGFEGALIMIAAVAIMHTAILDLVRGPDIQRLGTGLWITGGLAAVNLVLGIALVRTGKKHRSVILEANGHHVLTDMWTSVGVIAGLLLVYWTGFLWFDPVLAIIVALNILWTAFRLMRNSVRGLLETADASETERIRELLQEAVEKDVVSGFHQLRHRRINNEVWIEYHLLFPENLSVALAHDHSHRVEDAVHKLFPRDVVVVTAHLEPELHDEAHSDRRPEPLDVLGGGLS